MPSKELTITQVKSAIRKCLSPDLLKPRYRRERETISNKSARQVFGHCTVASEALFYFVGGRQAGYSPAVCTYYKNDKGQLHFGGLDETAIKHDKWERQSHWWIQAPRKTQRGAGRVHDVTAAQFDFVFPYHKGRCWSFMQPTGGPTLRAQKLIGRVEAILGKKALNAFRQKQIAHYQKRLAQKETGSSYPARSVTRQPISRRQKPSGQSI